jgi:hypothetical protein
MVMILGLFCRSLMVGGVDRDDVRSSFWLSMLMILWWFCRSLVVEDSIVITFDRAFGY